MAKTKTTSIRVRKAASKQEKIISLLKRPKGASLAEIGNVSDWQEHSIRGFISGTLKKRMQLNIESEKDGRGVRRYKIKDPEKTVAETSADEVRA